MHHALQITDGFIMTFSHALLSSAMGVLLISACGGGADENTLNTEKTVENPVVTEQPSTVTPTASPVVVEPSEEFAALPAPYSDADYARGRRTFKLCQSCHTLGEGGPNLVGPNLHGLFGRDIGSLEGFEYSNAVADAGFAWTPEKLDEWLAGPNTFLPGNRMAFSGVRKPQDRLAVIAYIMSETGYSAPPE